MGMWELAQLMEPPCKSRKEGPRPRVRSLHGGLEIKPQGKKGIQKTPKKELGLARVSVAAIS